ncbi:hypothetical protein ABIB99_004935 [Bradyrhizobium sp. LA6.1]|uniref:hypothetical protein n=1 Tax=Bradyrhizobium sp. LA6.1 TaxID=3156378 RepID=UPI00339784D3
MTLVVAKVTPHQIVMLADTRIQSPRQKRALPDVRSGSLKITFVASNVAIAFTGDPDIASAAIEDIRGGCTSFQSVISVLKNSSRGSGNEYLVGFAGPKRLFHVRGGEAKERRVAFIGDSVGFERFQSGPRAAPQDDSWHATMIGPDVQDQTLVHDQLARLQSVLEDRSILSVGDFFTVALSDGGTFRFPSVATMFFDAESRLLAPDGSALLTSTDERRHRFTTWYPRQRGLASSAFVFPDAQRAFVFYQGTPFNFANQCEMFDGLVGDQLADEIERRIGIRFEVFEIRHV